MAYEEPELLIADGVHPNADGYAIVVQNILKILDPALKIHLE
jgi:lysophospholipase L1-like esterase